jgi:hypothetical protein
MQQLVAQLRILSRGFGPSGSLNLALVGSFHLVTGGTGATSSGDRAKNSATKSSTMKGAKALGSKLWTETLPNSEKPSFSGKGTLLVSCPRNHRLFPVETMAGLAAGTCSDGVEVGPPSDVTARVKSSLIREGALLPPVVRRCLRGEQVLQKQRTGRVVQGGAARPLVGEERGRACCKAVASSFQRPDGTGRVTDNERTDG